MAPANSAKIGNVKLTVTDKKSVLNDIRQRLVKGIKTKVFFVNAHCFNVAQQDPLYRRNLNEAEIVLNDGIGIELGAKLFDVQLKENLNGTDFTPEVLRVAETTGLKLYLLGGKPGVAEQAAANLKKKFPLLNVAGVSDGYFEDSKQKVEEINRVKPDLLLVGMGVPLQENWITDHLEELDVSVAMAVGAFLDFTAGTVKRAPLFVRKVRMEWVFRLLIEPKRMWKRYVIGNVVFFLHIFTQSRKKLTVKRV